jgi:hypothetical protein
VIAALFDKSFLQSLSVNESVWFDRFFYSNICPLFFVETLADLEKEVREGRTQEAEVRSIAEKTPEMQGGPCVHHSHMVLSSLFGEDPPMTGQIPMANARKVRVRGKAGIVFDRPPELEAFSRWQRGRFKDLEREFARAWREDLAALNLEEVRRQVRHWGVDGKTCRTLDQARAYAADFVQAKDRGADRLRTCLQMLGVRTGLYSLIQERWSYLGRPPIERFAPYASFAAEVELFFRVGMAADLISTDRPSHRVDMSYLLYLPFCNVFISGDKLHRTCAPLFIRDDQSFVWAPDLKADLKSINAHYELLPEEIKVKGVMAYAHYPPGDKDSLTVQLWDRHLGDWRSVLVRNRSKDEPMAPGIRAQLDALSDALPIASLEEDFAAEDTEMVGIERFIAKRKGSVWQLASVD